MMYSYSLYNPLILRPTRISAKSETLLDNIFTNDSKNDSGILILDTSDHLPNFTLIKSIIVKSKDNQLHKNKRPLCQKFK